MHWMEIEERQQLTEELAARGVRLDEGREWWQVGMVEGETKEAEHFRCSASRSSRFPGLTRPETRPIDGVEVQSYRSARASVKTRPQVARARVHGRDPTGARGPRHTPRGWRRQQRSQHAAIEAGV